MHVAGQESWTALSKKPRGTGRKQGKGGGGLSSPSSF